MLLERETELTTLDALITESAASGGKVVLVRGEAGIGKSALVEELIARQRDRAHVMTGACDDLTTPQPFEAFWDMARTEPSIAEALGRGDPHGLHVAVLDLLTRSMRPTLLVIEDTQWAGEATLDAILYVGRRISRTAGVMLLTYRDGEVDVDHPLRQVIGDLPPRNIVRLHLDPLSRGAVSTMIEGVERSVDDVMALTDGNPLFVQEILASDSENVPTSISDMVLARLARSSVPTRELLELVSVVPGGATRELIESVLGPQNEAIAESRRLGLLRTDDGTVSFAHELQRRAVESSLPRQRTIELNRAVLDVLRGGGDHARLVHHASLAGDVETLLEVAPLAAGSAAAAGSSREAVRHYSVIEPYLDSISPTRAAEILEECSRQAYLIDHAAALERIQRALTIRRGLADPIPLARVLTFAARVEMTSANIASAIAYVNEAVELLEDLDDGEALADALSTLAHVTWLRYEDVPASLEIMDRALAIAEACASDRVIIQALRGKGSMEHSIGMKGGMEILEACRLRAERSGNRYEEVRALDSLASMAADVRDVDIAVDFARRSIETATRYEIRAEEESSKAMYAELLLWKGDWAAAEDLASEVLGSQPYTAQIAWRVLASIQIRRGRASARRALDRMWELAGSTDMLTIVDPAAAVIAEHLWLTDDRDPSWRDRLGEVLAFGLGVGFPWPSGAFAFWMWKLGWFDQPDAIEDFYGWIMQGDHRRAVEFWDRRGIPYEKALALMHGSEAERIEAVRLAEELGALALASRIRRSLADEGVRVPRGRSRSTLDNAAGLTARQAEVLGLIAEGMSNPDIADRLFISIRTVENHVAAILLKLDATDREQAVTIAIDRSFLAADVRGR